MAGAARDTTFLRRALQTPFRVGSEPGTKCACVKLDGTDEIVEIQESSEPSGWRLAPT